VILGGGGQQEIPPTSRLVNLNGVKIAHGHITGADNEVLEYHCTIIDVREATTYRFDFGPQMREDMIKALTDLQPVGHDADTGEAKVQSQPRPVI